MANDNNKTPPQSAKTVLSGKIDDKTQLSQSPEGSVSPKQNEETQLAPEYLKALTEIETNLQTHTTQQGFANAKADADKALAENKIILNQRFVLEETLGSGGMGTVFKAQDLRKVEARDTNLYVAVKILNNDFRNHPDAFISLQREASRSHLLSHPNIVTVHDFDREGETIYMTMELLDGEDLEVLINKNRDKGLDKDKALQIFKDFCLALEFAHKKEIIHSDLKPGNIFVTNDEGTKILDFGIARLGLDSKQKDHFDAGRIGAITPAYASLEMIAHQPPDPSDDVYAAAVICYELLTGKHPYGAISAAAAHAKGLKPERIPELTKRQWKALSKGLELQRENRTSDIRELLDGLTVKPKLPVFRTVSLVLISVLAWFTYNYFFAPNEIREVIAETFIKAEQCIKDKNYQCSIESGNAILELDPGNQRASTLVKKAKIELSAESIENCFKQEESIACAIEQLEQLLTLGPPAELLAKMNAKVEAHKRSITITRLAKESQDCFKMGDFSCSLEKSKRWSQLAPDSQPAKRMLQNSQREIEHERIEAENKDKQFKKLMAKAEQCLKLSDFVCAQNESTKALELNPNNKEASELVQNAAYAQKQKIASLAKADKVLKDGQECLKKLNYSCAIAKSESALEFVPNYKKALQLKKKATESLNSVKKKIQIE